MKVSIISVNNPDFAAIDITNPHALEVKVREDGKVVWVNVDGICRFRACMIEKLSLEIPKSLKKKN